MHSEILIPNLQETGRSVSQKNKQRISVFDTWIFGVLAVLGGNFVGWNAGVSAGFASFLLSTVLSGVAYIAMTYCNSEILTAFPFSGGAYGMIRCTVGFFPGFIVAYSELLYYILYVSLSISPFAQMIAKVVLVKCEACGPAYQTFWCFVLHTISSVIILYASGRTIFWRLTRLFGFTCIVLVTIYCVGIPIKLVAYPIVETSTFSSPKSATIFFQSFPFSTWLFIGIESIAFTCNITISPKTTVARGSIVCILSSFIGSIAMVGVGFCLPFNYQIISTARFSLSSGFMYLFGCSQIRADLLSIPSTFASAYGFVFSYGKLLSAISGSGLAPYFLQRTTSIGTPFASTIFCSLFSFLVSALMSYNVLKLDVASDVCLFLAFFTYFCQCFSYIYLKKSRKFRFMTFLVKRPVKIVGAIYALLIFLMGMISILFFGLNGYIVLQYTAVFWAVISISYFFVFKKSQTFSREEQTSFLTVYTLNYNNKRITRRLKRRKCPCAKYIH